MQGWVYWVAGLVLGLVVACGGGSGEQEAPCGQILGEELVVPLLNVHNRQVELDVRIGTVDRTYFQTLGFPLTEFAPIISGTPGATPGSNCGASTGTDTMVVGGAVRTNVIVPEGTSGEQALPSIEPSPVTPNDGALVFTNMGGPGVFTVGRSWRRALDGLDPVPVGQVLPPLTGVGGQSFNYGLTDDLGLASLLVALQAGAVTRLVQAPKTVTLDNQTATVFVGTERPAVGDLTQPHRDRVVSVSPGIGCVSGQFP